MALGSNTPKQIGQASKFQVDFGGEGDTIDKNWYEIRGGGVILHSTEITHGQSKFKEKKTSDVEYGEITLVGPMVPDRKTVLDFVNSWCQPSGNAGNRIDGTIKFMNENDEVVRTYNFFGAAPVRFEPPAVDATTDQLLEESLTYKAYRIEEA